MPTEFYRREDGSTNYHRVNSVAITDEDWARDRRESGTFIVILSGPMESLCELLTGPEVNELAGRVIVTEPAVIPREKSQTPSMKGAASAVRGKERQ